MDKIIRWVFLPVVSLFMFGFLGTVLAQSASPNDGDSDSSTNTCITFQTPFFRYLSTDKKTNGEVSILQDFLISKNFLSGSPTGYYGRLTVSAVKAYQKSVGVSPTGNVGSLTKNIIEKDTCSDDGGVSINPTNTYNPKTNPVACTMEYRTCPDGSAMSRDADCTWRADKCGVDLTSTSVTIPVPVITSVEGKGGFGTGESNSVYGKYFSSTKEVYLTNISTGVKTVLKHTIFSDTQVNVIVPDMVGGGYRLYVVNQSGKSAPYEVGHLGPMTSTPTIEPLGTPTLTLTYNSAGKEANLVGKISVKVTAGSEGIVVDQNSFRGMATLFNTSGTPYYTSGATYTYGGASSSAGTKLAPYTSATFNVTATVKAGQLFAGSYYVKPVNFAYMNSAGSYEYTGDLKSSPSSNTVTIIGETSPYITEVGSDSTSVKIYGVRFHSTANTVTISGVSKTLPSSNEGKVIYATMKDFGITSAGTYVVQVSTGAGASNSFAFTTGQVAVNMSVSQVLGASTMCVNLSSNLHRGAESSSVTKLQKFLSSKGFLTAAPTGFYGDMTVEAVKLYQSSVGITSTGMVYDLTRQAIKMETCN